MLNLYQLQSFVTVLAEGSMTAAADKLYLTQPAISQQIRNLEEELGMELLVRGVRQIKPTLQGEVLYDYAKKIIQLAASAEVAIKALGADLKGSLCVGALNSMGVQLMSPIVSRLLKFNPEIKIKVDYSKGEELIQNFNKGLIDVLILPEIETQFGMGLPEVEKLFLFKEEMWLVGNGKDTDMPKQIQIKDLGRYPLIQFLGEYPHFNQSLQQALTQQKVEPDVSFESANVGTLKRVIETGLGWGFLPSTAIRKQVRMGRMNRVDIQDFTYEIDVFYYKRKKTDALADVFYQALAQQER
jgi:DNA-binding transcriptional LysR family regulator